MQNNKILLTGSCGFIGSNLVRRFVLEKYRLVSLDKGNKKDVSSIYNNKSHKFYLSNLNDVDILEQIFTLESPDVVIHAAFEKDLTIKSTQNLIDVCKGKNIKKIIYLSDVSVYGPLKSPVSNLALETQDLNPQTNYAKHKVECENLIKESGIDYIIARLSNNYGPRQQDYNLIPGVIKAALKKEVCDILSPNYLSEYTHVFDTCSALTTLVENDTVQGIYNVSSNQEFTTMEVVHEVCSILDKYHNIKHHEMIKYKNDTSECDVMMNSSKIKALGWVPSIKFKAGLEDTTDWFCNNPWNFNLK